LPAERLIGAPPIVSAGEFGEISRLLEPFGRRTQLDPFLLYPTPKALDANIVVAASAAIHADLDPMIQQHAA
jgi:hypothetical protein